MALSRSHDEQLSQVRALRSAPDTASIEAELAPFLDSRFPMIVAGAAELAAQRNYAALCPALVAAFQRFLQTPESSDKGCVAKTAIATALYNLKYSDTDFFFRHLHYVQMDAAFGGKVDSAGEVRGRCILALAQLEFPNTLLEAVSLLIDSSPSARIGAIRALNMVGTVAAMALLQLRALDGEKDAEALAEILMALLELDADRNLPFVGHFLNSREPAHVEAAALALGSARRPEAVALLTKAWHTHQQSRLEQPILLAIGMTRTDIGQKFLLTQVERESLPTARLAISALAIFKHDQRVTGLLLAVIDRHAESTLLRPHFQREFGSR